MAHLSAIGTGRTSEAHIRDLLYKADHPRQIDRYIDFFGEGGAGREPAADCCGDVLLESLA